jgi:hypothetical protein
VEARAAQLIAEEMTLRELRHARKLTQVRMAKTLGSATSDSFPPIAWTVFRNVESNRSDRHLHAAKARIVR